MSYKNREDQRKAERRWYRRNRGKVIQRRSERRKKLKAWVNELKVQIGCERCDETHPAALDFHHIGEKENEISRMANFILSKTRILKEIQKCIVLCSNCHRKEHWG